MSRRRLIVLVVASLGGEKNTMAEFCSIQPAYCSLILKVPYYEKRTFSGIWGVIWVYGAATRI